MKINLNLVNGEIVDVKPKQIKGCLDGRDSCLYFDYAKCSANAIDICNTDYSACTGTSYDECNYDSCGKDSN